ncbi:MAG TPA: hypothetical protein PL029_01710 [Bacteroidia bacterium]|nr:hypothetical protein [Bacteroidia bacterium]
MQKIIQIIDEIRQLKAEPTHRSAMRICSLMENNKKLFVEVIDPSDFNYLFSGFENLSFKNHSEISTARGVEEYNKFCENLLFHCNRIV